MVSRQSVDDQLKKIGYKYSLWGRGEASQLPSLLMDNEVIIQCLNGRYKAGFAMLCATSQRVLLIDRKPLQYLAVEDLCYDRITQINFDYRLFEASIHFYTNNVQALDFRSWNKQSLRKLLNYVQQRVAELHWREEQQQYRREQMEQRIISDDNLGLGQSMPDPGLAGVALSGSSSSASSERVTRFIVNSMVQAG